MYKSSLLENYQKILAAFKTLNHNGVLDEQSGALHSPQSICICYMYLLDQIGNKSVYGVKKAAAH